VEKTLDKNILSKGMIISYSFATVIAGLAGITFSYMASVLVSIAILLIVDIPKEQTQYIMDESFFYIYSVSSIFSALVGVCFFIKGTRKSIKKIKVLKTARLEKENKIEELSETLKEKVIKFDSIEEDLKLAKVEIDSIYSVVKEYAKANGFSESEMRQFFKTGLELKTEKENDETKIQTIKETLGSLRSTDIEMTNLGKDIDYSNILIYMNRVFSFTLVTGTITAFISVTGLLFSNLFWSFLSTILIVALLLSVKQYFDLKPIVKHLDKDYKLNAIKSNKEWATRHERLSDSQRESIMLLKKIRSEVNDLSNLKEGLFKKEWNDFIFFSS
jgi:hypothetical protein